MTKIRLPFVQAFQARGRAYFYFRRPGSPRTRLPGLPGSAEFMAAYQAALAGSGQPTAIGATRNAPGSIAALIAAYAGSAKFKYELAQATREGQWQILQRFRDEHGERGVATLKNQHVRAILAEKRPHPRRSLLKTLRSLMRFAVDIGMIAADPTEGIKVKTPKGEGFRTWGDDEIATFRRYVALGTPQRLAFELLLCTVLNGAATSPAWGRSMSATGFCTSAKARRARS